MQLKTCDMPGYGDGASIVIEAPEDCTETQVLGRLPERARRALQRGARHIVIDLSAVQHMNSSLIAVVTLLLREARRMQATLRVIRAPEQFRTWAATLNVLPFISACVVFADAPNDSANVAMCPAG